MPEPRATSVCIVGAGAMGLVTGYLLSRSDAAVTFLVRPHRLEGLSRPQMLYSYDDDSLAAYSDYDVLADPAGLNGASFDFVVVTLDATALRAEAGLKLAGEIGRAFRGTSTAVVLGSVGIDVRSWFLSASGLADTQVINGALESVAYQVPPAPVPMPPGVDESLHSRADLAYRHIKPIGFTVDLSAPQAARDFASLYDRNGLTRCKVVPADEYRPRVAIFPVLAAWELLSWPALASVDPHNETWRLGVDAMREFQRLSIVGPAGLQASQQVTAEGILGFLRELEKAALPLDYAAFNAYHHGGKVNSQDHAILREALTHGEAEGAAMPALRTLVARLPEA